ncbi:MAG TPA: TolC family protein [Usitatibacter sp.]|nr:TolC family protein [Usitatibacter sp.]
MRALRHRALLAALVLGGCALQDPPAREDVLKESVPNMAAPAQWAAGATPGAVADDWLAGFKDPRLDALVKEAIAYNSDLRIAAARVEAASAALAGVQAPSLPQVNAAGRGGGKMSGDSSGLQGAGIFASWEIDLWGRVRSAVKASEMQYQSAQLDTEYARQSIAALVAKGWIVAIEARLQQSIADNMLASAERLAALARDRLRVGNGDQYDVALADANVQSLRDTVRSLELSYASALRALEALVGRYPAGAVAVAEALPPWPGDTPAGLPSELLERRPDVVAAERRVAAAFYRTQEAKAARLPRITLVASYTSVNSDLFVLQPRDNPVASAGASIVQPLFLGGALQSQLDVRTAEQAAAIADYGKVGLRAFNEVEGTLAAGATATDREKILARGVSDNARALDLANVRYRVGSIDLRAVQQQQLALGSARAALLRVQSDRLVQLVNLHLALGGSFEPRPQPAAEASAH